MIPAFQRADSEMGDLYIMLLALLVFAFAEYFRDPFGLGLSSMSNISFRKGRNVDIKLQYKAQARRVLLTLALISQPSFLSAMLLLVDECSQS